MNVTLQTIEETEIPGVYRARVQIEAQVHHFEVTVTTAFLTGAPAPLLTTSGDHQFYEVLGFDPSYPAILQQVSRYHQGETISLPLVVQGGVPA